MESVTLTQEEKAWAEEDSVKLAPTHAHEIVKALARFWLVTVKDKTVTVARPEVMARMLSSTEQKQRPEERKKRAGGKKGKSRKTPERD